MVPGEDTHLALKLLMFQVIFHDSKRRAPI